MTGDVVGLGIVGTGRWAGAHAEAAARSPSLSLVSCFSRNTERREAFATEFGVARAARSLDQLISSAEVEAVIVVTPNDTHVDIARQVLAAGKPVLVDKPVAASVAGGVELLRAEGAATSCAVAHHARRLAGHRAARRWLDSNPGTEARVAHAAFANSRGAHVAPDAWRRRGPGSEGGVLTQVGIHQVDVLAYLLGPVQSVSARFSYGAPGPGIAESAILSMSHTSGALSTLNSAWTTPGHYRLDLLTTLGNLSFHLDPAAWWRSPDVDEHSELLIKEPGNDAATVPIVGGDPLVEQLEELGAVARHGAPVEIGVVEGLRAVAVVHSAIASAGRGGAAIDLAEILREAGASSEEIDLVIGRAD